VTRDSLPVPKFGVDGAADVCSGRTETVKWQGETSCRLRDGDVRPSETQPSRGGRTGTYCHTRAPCHVVADRLQSRSFTSYMHRSTSTAYNYGINPVAYNYYEPSCRRRRWSTENTVTSKWRTIE